MMAAMTNRSYTYPGKFLLGLILLALSISYSAGSGAQEVDNSASMQDGMISLTLRDVAIAEVMEMISKTAKVNILLSENIQGNVSVNLYEIGIDDAIQSIATSAGYAVERRKGSYFIVDRDQAGKSDAGGPTQLRTFKVQYSDPAIVAGALEKHLSSFGTITTLEKRRLLVVDDKPHFLRRIENLLKELDRKPKQILIEARILEVGLKDSESYGLDWSRIFNSDKATIGTQGLSNPGSPGLFFDYLSPNVTVVLDALRQRSRLRTLSTPKLLALEDQEAETIIGDRLGYNVTTTIDNVTTTSTEFLESGVILRVRPSVDEQNRILLDIHPEVSTGSVSDDGVPNQNTTEVTTSMLVESGKTVFIGGLIRRTSEQSREGVPVLGDLPVVGLLFSNKALSTTSTELVVLITPYIVDDIKVPLDNGKSQQVSDIAKELNVQPKRIEKILDEMEYFDEALGMNKLDDTKNENNQLDDDWYRE
jgi:type II secretory pathway component GspD/PulD (secretin)